METTIQPAFVSYDHAKLGFKVPSKRSLSIQKDSYDLIFKIGIGIIVGAVIWWAVQVIHEFRVRLSDDMAMIMDPNYTIVRNSDQWMPYVLYALGAAVTLASYLLKDHTKDRWDKFHAVVHFGEIVAVEIVQKEGEPLMRVLTIRGYTIGGTRTLYTFSEPVGLNEDVDPYHEYVTGKTYDGRDETLRAASLQA